MKVNIVLGDGDRNWIGGRFARELASRLPALGFEATINGTGDLHYHQIVYGDPERRPAVGMFTHGETRPRRHATAYDGQVAVNPAVRDYLRDAGAEDPALIEMPVGGQFRLHRPLVFGVAGRVYSDGRKGEQLVVEMLKAGYDVRAWGHGWPCPIVSDQLAALPSFYSSIDYFIDTSMDEGGCVPALEAIAIGKPVISHGFGVTYPSVRYERGSWQSLSDVLRRLTTPRTYDDWAREHASYFARVLSRLQVPA